MKTKSKLICYFISFILLPTNIFIFWEKENKHLNEKYNRLLNDGKTNKEEKHRPKLEQSPKLPIEEYIRVYDINHTIHHICKKQLKRPQPSEISWRKDTYQKMVVKFENYPECDVFGMRCYFDDRFLSKTSERHIRCIIAIEAPGTLDDPESSNFKEVVDWTKAMHNHTWTVLLWYDGFEDPINVKCKIQTAAGLNREANNQFFFQEIVTCVVPEIDIFPVSASIINNTCDFPKTNFEIFYPQLSTTPANQEIGVCMASLFGHLSIKDVPRFVNWIESLKHFGINHVNFNNSTLILDDSNIKRAFQYYIDKGMLTVTHFPPVHIQWSSPKDDDNASEAVNKLTTGDCIYRNLKRYWYVLIIDMDELPVPTSFDTYQEFLSDYTTRHPNATHAHCLSVRSSFFYLDQKPGNPEYGVHLPFLRLTNRFRPEPIEVDGIGMSKSFHNMRNMVAAGHHITRQTHFGGGSKHVHQEFTTPEDILIHHYRRTCKYTDFCINHWNDTIHDDIIPRKYGRKLKENIESVLRKISYPF